MASKKLSLLLPQLRDARARLASASSRSMQRTVISFTNFCPLLPMNVRTITEVHSRIERDSAVRLLLQFDRRGLTNCRYSCASLQRIGSMADGVSMSRSNLAGN